MDAICLDSKREGEFLFVSIKFIALVHVRMAVRRISVRGGVQGGRFGSLPAGGPGGRQPTGWYAFLIFENLSSITEINLKFRFSRKISNKNGRILGKKSVFQAFLANYRLFLCEI